MKNTILLPLLLMIFVGCSVDNEDELVPENGAQQLELETNLFSTASATTVSSYCRPQTFDIGKYGTLEVKHDGFDLFVTITANEGYDLVDTKLHLDSDETSFPLVGNGNLPPGQMADKTTFTSGTKSHTFTFDIITDLGGTLTSIASKTNFTDGTNTFSAWAGNEKGLSGNWFYLNYEIIACCEMAYAGVDFTWTVTKGYYERYIGVAATLREFLLTQVYKADKTAVISGKFKPTAGVLDQTYNDWSGQGGTDADLYFETTGPDGSGNLILQTTYTVGQGSCADTASITLYIDPNPAIITPDDPSIINSSL